MNQLFQSCLIIAWNQSPESGYMYRKFFAEIRHDAGKTGIYYREKYHAQNRKTSRLVNREKEERYGAISFTKGIYFHRIRTGSSDDDGFRKEAGCDDAHLAYGG